MKLMVDIDEELYKKLCGGYIPLLYEIYEMVINGTPLSKDYDKIPELLQQDLLLDKIRKDIAQRGDIDINTQLVLYIIDKYRGKVECR